MAQSASISTGIAERYATAIFELAKEEKALDALGTDVSGMTELLAESDAFRAMISSPIYSREDQAAAVTAVAEKAGFSANMTNLLKLMASKRRLFVLPAMARALDEMLSAERGEVTAEVTAATALTKDQEDKLASTLKSRVGKDVKINMSVDESLIGGLVVKVGSKMIDTSIRSKLQALQNTMKEVG